MICICDTIEIADKIKGGCIMSKLIIAVTIIIITIFVGYAIGSAAQDLVNTTGDRTQKIIDTYNYCK